MAFGGTGALLVSPFNVEWRCYVQDEGVVVLEFYLFLVVFPARCISSISPRFYSRKHTFCFLPLVAILESPISITNFSKCARFLSSELVKDGDPVDNFDSYCHNFDILT
jgi:hypothetical protein